MKETGSRLRDRTLALAFVALGLLCFLAASMPGRFGLARWASAPASFVGKLNKDAGDVRHRTHGELAWQDMTGQTAEVQDGDTVYTGPSAKADLELFSGQKATIFPNSMVVIRKEAAHDQASGTGWLARLGIAFHKAPSVQRIELKSGSLHLSGLSSEKPIEISANGTTYRLETSPPPAKPGAPTGAQPMSADVSLTDHLQVSSPSGAKTRLVPVERDTESGPASGPGGALAKNGGDSDVDADTGAGATAPMPIAPLVTPPASKAIPTLTVQVPAVSTRLFDGEHFAYVPVKVRWNPIPEARAYRVQVFHGSTAVVDHQLGKQPEPAEFDFHLSRLDSVPYDVRISATLDSGLTVASAKTRLNIESVPPSLTLPESQPLKQRSHIVIAWERTLLAHKYRIQIASDPDFKDLRMDRETALNVEPFRAPAQSGKLWVRVQSLLSRGTSPWSAPRELDVE